MAFGDMEQMESSSAPQHEKVQEEDNVEVSIQNSTC
mgnify:CR=1 FL=1